MGDRSSEVLNRSTDMIALHKLRLPGVSGRTGIGCCGAKINPPVAEENVVRYMSR